MCLFWMMIQGPGEDGRGVYGGNTSTCVLTYCINKVSEFVFKCLYSLIYVFLLDDDPRPR